MDLYSPTSLPTITTVEVILLQGIAANRVDQYVQNATGKPSITLDGAAAQRIADLWRKLPPGEQARCHVPRYGLCFYTGERVVCQASVCWECNNLVGEAEGRELHYEFDGKHSTSQELLTEVRKAFNVTT
jgi:hypothetical protein